MNCPRKSPTIPPQITLPSWSLAFLLGAPSPSLAFGWDVLYWISPNLIPLATPCRRNPCPSFDVHDFSAQPKQPLLPLVNPVSALLVAQHPAQPERVQRNHQCIHASQQSGKLRGLRRDDADLNLTGVGVPGSGGNPVVLAELVEPRLLAFDLSCAFGNHLADHAFHRICLLAVADDAQDHVDGVQGFHHAAEFALVNPLP